MMNNIECFAMYIFTGKKMKMTCSIFENLNFYSFFVVYAAFAIAPEFKKIERFKTFENQKL